MENRVLGQIIGLLLGISERASRQGRGWQGHVSFKKVSLAKDTTVLASGLFWIWKSAFPDSCCCPTPLSKRTHPEIPIMLSANKMFT
jgi:hypothetical protein